MSKVTPPHSTLTPPKLGEIWPGQGGHLAALMRGINGQPDYYLIAANKQHVGNSIEFGGYGSTTKGAECTADGEQNTADLIKDKGRHPAAIYAKNIVIDGLSDYYLPSRREARAIAAACPELLPADWMWTSTQSDANDAWLQGPGGIQSWGYKDFKAAVLPVRRLLVIE